MVHKLNLSGSPCWYLLGSLFYLLGFVYLVFQASCPPSSPLTNVSLRGNAKPRHPPTHEKNTNHRFSRHVLTLSLIILRESVVLASRARHIVCDVRACDDAQTLRRAEHRLEGIWCIKHLSTIVADRSTHLSTNVF
jgi:hypothetical protein